MSQSVNVSSGVSVRDAATSNAFITSEQSHGPTANPSVGIALTNFTNPRDNDVLPGNSAPSTSLPPIGDSITGAISDVAPFAGPAGTGIAAVAKLANAGLNLITSPMSTNGMFLGGASDPAAHNVLVGAMNTSTSLNRTVPNLGYNSYRDNSSLYSKTASLPKLVNEPAWLKFDLAEWFGTFRLHATGTVGGSNGNVLYNHYFTVLDLITAYQTNDTTAFTQGIFTAPGLTSLFTFLTQSRFTLEFMVECISNTLDSVPLTFTWTPTHIPEEDALLPRVLCPHFVAQMRDTSRFTIQVPWFLVPEFATLSDPTLTFGRLTLWNFCTPAFNSSAVSWRAFVRIINIDTQRFGLPTEMPVVQSDGAPERDSTKPEATTLLAPALVDHALEEPHPDGATSLFAASHRYFTSERPILSSDMMFGDRIFSTITNSGLQREVPFYLWPVAPNSLASRNNAGDNTKPLTVHPIFLLSQAFAYWKGGVEFNVQFVSTSQSAGKFMIAHWPLPSAPTALALKSTYNQTADVNFARSVRIIANQKGIYKIRACARANRFDEAGLPVSNPMEYTDGNGAATDEISSGFIIGMPLTNIALNNVPTTNVLEYVISARACPDLAFSQLVGYPASMSVIESDSNPEADQHQSVNPTFSIPFSSDPMRDILKMPAVGYYTMDNSGNRTAIAKTLRDMPGYPVIKSGMHFRGGATVRLILTGPSLIVGKLVVEVLHNSPPTNVIPIADVNAAAMSITQASTVRERHVLDITTQRDFSFRCPYDNADPLSYVDANPIVANFLLSSRGYHKSSLNAGNVQIFYQVTLDDDFHIFNMRSVQIRDDNLYRTFAALESDSNPEPDIPKCYFGPCYHCTTPMPMPVAKVHSTGLVMANGKPRFRGESTITTTIVMPDPVAHAPGKLESLWDDYLVNHYRLNRHHPEHECFNHDHEMHQICQLDVLSSITRSTNNFEAAFKIFVDVMKGTKFDKVCVPCRKAFSIKLHRFISIDGVLRPADVILPYTKYNQWRNVPYIMYHAKKYSPVPLEHLVYDLLTIATEEQRQMFLADFVPMRRCMAEIRAHIDNMTRLTEKLLKFDPKIEVHDADKLDSKVAIAYFMKWGLNIEGLHSSWPPVGLGTMSEWRCGDLSFEKITTSPRTEADADPEVDTCQPQGGFLTKFMPEVPIIKQAKETMASAKAAADNVNGIADTATTTLSSVLAWFRTHFENLKRGLPSLTIDTQTLVGKVAELLCAAVAFWKSDSWAGRAATIIQTLISFEVSLELAGKLVELLKYALEAAQDRKLPSELHLKQETTVGEAASLPDSAFDIKEETPKVQASVLGDMFRSMDVLSKVGVGETVTLGLPFALFSVVVGVLFGKSATNGQYFSFMKSAGSTARDFINVLAVSALTVEAAYLLIGLIKKIYSWWCSINIPEANKAHAEHDFAEKIFAWNGKVRVLLGHTPEDVVMTAGLCAEMRTLHAQGHVYLDEAIVKNANREISGPLVGYITKASNLLDELAAAANAALVACQTRTTPAAYRLVSTPGMGKTSIINALAARVAAANGDVRASVSEYIYSWSVHARFQEGYFGQPCLRIEEPDADRSKNTAHLELLRIISSDPYLVSKAHLDQKNTWLASKYIFLSTNSKTPEINLSEPSAYLRRFRDIDVYSVGPKQPDFAHLRFTVGPPPPCASGNVGQEGMNFEGLVNWLVGDTKRHFENETIVSTFTQTQFLAAQNKGTYEVPKAAVVTTASLNETPPSRLRGQPIIAFKPQPSTSSRPDSRPPLNPHATPFTVIQGPSAPEEDTDDEDSGDHTSSSSSSISHENTDEYIDDDPITLDQEAVRTATIINKSQKTYIQQMDSFTIEEVQSALARIPHGVSDATVSVVISKECLNLHSLVSYEMQLTSSILSTYFLAELAYVNTQEGFFRKLRTMNTLMNSKHASPMYAAREVIGKVIKDNVTTYPVDQYCEIALREVENFAFLHQLGLDCVKCETTCTCMRGCDIALWNALNTFAALIRRQTQYNFPRAFLENTVRLYEKFCSNIAEQALRDRYQAIAVRGWSLMSTGGKVLLVFSGIAITAAILKLIMTLFRSAPVAAITTTAVASVASASKKVYQRARAMINGKEQEVLVESYSGMALPQPTATLGLPSTAIKILQSDSSPLDNIYDCVIRPSIATVTAHWETNGQPLRLPFTAMAVFGQWFMMPKHQYHQWKAYNPTSYSISTSGYHASAFASELSVATIRDDMDIVLFRFKYNTVPTSRAVYKHFVRRSACHVLAETKIRIARANAKTNYRSSADQHIPRVFDIIHDTAKLNLIASLAGPTPEMLGSDPVYVTRGTWDYHTSMAGCCGSPIMSADPAHPVVLGLHISGATNEGHAALVTREDIEEFMQFISVRERVCSPSIPALEVPEGHTILLQGDYAISKDKLPSAEAHHLPTKHHYQTMPTYNIIHPNDREPAPLHDGDDRNHYNECILKNCTAKYAAASQPLPPSIINSFEEGFKAEIDACTYPNKRFLSQEEAINGVPGTNIMRMNFESSAGLPFSQWPEVKQSKGKLGLFQFELDYMVPTPRFQQSLDDLMSSWMDGEREDTVYCDSQKVELLPLEKTRPYLFVQTATKLDCYKECPIYYGPQQVAFRHPKEGEQLTPSKSFKCRLIDAPASHRTVLARRFNATFQDMLMENRHQLGIMVGINPCSSEWGLLINDLEKVNPLINDADFTNFDGIHARGPLTMVARIYHHFLLQDPNYANNLELHVAQAANWDELITRTVIVKNLRYITNHGLASGHDCTTPINCILLKLYLYVAWFILATTNEPKLANYHDFKRLTCSKVYGDDSLWSVIPTNTWYTAKNIAGVLALFGITYTPAQKFLKDFPPPRPITELTFLSRSFTKHPTIPNVYYAMLKDQSANALLNWVYVKGRSRVVAIRDNVEQYLRHIFMKGEEHYNQQVALLRKHLSSYLNTTNLPTWIDLEHEFEQAWGVFNPATDCPVFDT